MFGVPESAALSVLDRVTRCISWLKVTKASAYAIPHVIDEATQSFSHRLGQAGEKECNELVEKEW